MRHYFHIHVADGASEVDEVGADFPNEALAINEARNLARELMAEAVKIGSKLTQLVEVTDQTGRKISRLDGYVELRESGSPP
jgi:hypothetical protein